MKALSWVVAGLLSLSILLLSVLGTFHDDRFHEYAYRRNGAYEALGKGFAWEVTENWQAYLLDEESLYVFAGEQAAHLAEVKLVYLKARVVLNAALFLAVALLAAALLSVKGCFYDVLLKTAFKTVLLTAFLALLSLSWEWFFSLSHALLFSGVWRFSSATLVLRLWGDNFFPLAAGYVFLKNVVMAGLLFLLARAWRWFISPRLASR
ncbi:DUF1461 domain-containing protein [Candidatus Woesearchaeota archaeon]|nr:DUF1461 domain-containing protein [Candidatus Woesearchaeota archaeon]